MKNFIKKNWFKLIILIILFWTLILLTSFLSEYKAENSDEVRNVKIVEPLKTGW